MNEPADVDGVLITRIFDAPREEVFNAWTDPDQIATWYGPAHMEAPREQINVDLRVGGRWELTMVPLGSADISGGFSLGYDIIELSPPELLVMRSDPMPEMGMPESSVLRLEFHDHGPKTRMTLTDAPFPEAGRRPAAASWGAAFDKLNSLLG